MNLIDSSAWLEYFADGGNSQFFSSAIENTQALVVPTLILYEVFKRIAQQKSEHEALQAVAVMRQGLVVDLTASLALLAARLSLELHLPLADSVILATAREQNALLWTQDSHFEGLPRVKYRKATPDV